MSTPDRQESPVDQAEDWLDDQTQTEGNRPKGLEDASHDPSVAELRREQRREIEHVNLGTEGQTHGAVFGSMAGVVLGALLGLAVGLVLFEGSGQVIAPVMGGLFGSVVGLVYWGGRAPELENETMTTTGLPESGTTPRDPGTDDRGR
jgi:hypothetical protein